MKRVIAGFLAAVLVPACRDGDDDDRGGSAVLLFDDFNRSQVGSDWNAFPGTGTMAIDGSQGSPAPALGMSVSQGNSAATAATLTSFSARPFTAGVDLHAATSGQGSGGVDIVNASGAVLASAERFANLGGDMTFMLGGNVIIVPLPSSPPGFQTVRLNVDAQGNASWTLGDTVVMTRTGFPAGPVSLRLFTRAGTVLPGSSFPLFLFDNVRVTSI